MDFVHADALPPRTVTAVVHDHAVQLPGGAWCVWRTAALRGAGFAAALVDTLAAPRAAALADAYVARDADVARTRRCAIREIAAAASAADAPTGRTLLAIREKVIRGRVPRDRSLPAVRAFADAIDRRTQVHAEFMAAFDADARALDESLQQLVHDGRFSEAALWQNRAAFDLVRRRLSQPDGRGADRRRAAEYVAMLAQRYAVKNDSIGFFGPVGWATIVDAPMHISCTPAPALVKERTIYFEEWAIDALAEHLNANPALRPWLAPRIKTGVWLGPDGVHVPCLGAADVTPAELELLRLCDGRRSAKDIASAMIATAPNRWSEDETFAALGRLVERDLLRWRLEVASQLHPEQELERRLLDVGDPILRDESLALLRELIDGRRAVSRAAGQPSRLAPALGELDDTFRRITKLAPTRRPGELYAARSLVYEDCVRACDVAIGAEWVARLGPPLSIVLQAALSVSAEWRTLFSNHLRAWHEELRTRVGSAVIDGHTFVKHVAATLKGPDGKARRGALLPDARAIVRERYQQRWRTLMADPDTMSRDPDAMERLAARAGRLFAADACGSWGGYFSPDVLVSAPGPDAARRGEYRFVLGEVHSGNTLLQSALITQHPDPDALIAALSRDTDGADVIVFQYPKNLTTARVNLRLAAGSWRYQEGEDLPAIPPCRQMPAGLLVAVDEGAGVRMRARDGSVEVDAYDLFAQYLHHDISALIGGRFPDAAHTPRVAIGDLTIARERWQFGRRELPFLEESDRAARFLKIRAWARRHELPRRVFCRFPGELKPCYTDFDSLIYTDTLTRLCRRLDDTAVVTMFELLPDLDNLWLTDADGAAYTSELRLVARLRRSFGA